MKYFISLISALLFTFTVFAQGVLEIKQHRYSTGHHYPRHSHDQFTESRLAQKSASPR